MDMMHSPGCDTVEVDPSVLPPTKVLRFELHSDGFLPAGEAHEERLSAEVHRLLVMPLPELCIAGELVLNRDLMPMNDGGVDMDAGAGELGADAHGFAVALDADVELRVGVGGGEVNHLSPSSRCAAIPNP